MKIVFDLDYTLLDTVKFKEALVAAAGVEPKAYEAAYADSVAANKGLFKPDAFFKELADRDLLPDAAAARRRFDAVLETTEKYLYPEAKELLEALGGHEVTVDLMTFGEAAWQKAKVERSGLAHMFDEVLYAEKDKKEFIRGLGQGHDKVIVVNDNGKEMKEMIAEAPEHSYIMKKGPKGVPDDLHLPIAETIGEVAALLEKETGWELRREMTELKKEGREGRIVASGEDVRGKVEVDVDGDEGKTKEPPDPRAGERRL